MEWTNDMALCFLRTYSKYPVLYNPGHENYKRKHHVDSAWQSINDDLASWGYTIDELKKKKDSLAGYYRIHLNKIKKMRAKGKQYRTSWFAFDTMHSFLSRIYDVGINAVARDGDNTDEDDGSESKYFLEEEYLDVDRKPVLASREAESEDDSCSIASNSTNLNRSLACPRVSSIDKLKSVEKTDKEAETCSRKKRMSENELFAELLVRKLSRLDEDVRLGLMNDIDNLVYKTSIEAKKNGNTTSHDPLN